MLRVGLPAGQSEGVMAMSVNTSAVKSVHVGPAKLRIMGKVPSGWQRILIQRWGMCRFEQAYYSQQLGICVWEFNRRN